MIITWNLTIPQLSGDQTRRAYVYVPQSYGEDLERRYPVMYFFDGQNIFFDDDAAFGTSWGMEGYMLESEREMILVAIECNREGSGRLEEYSPFTFENSELGRIKGRGKQYMHWLIKELKPYIDETYRTLPDRENTMIAGSSMGGHLQSRLPAGRLPEPQPVGRPGENSGAHRPGAHPPGHLHLPGLRCQGDVQPRGQCRGSVLHRPPADDQAGESHLPHRPRRHPLRSQLGKAGADFYGVPGRLR